MITHNSNISIIRITTITITITMIKMMVGGMDKAPELLAYVCVLVALACSGVAFANAKSLRFWLTPKV